MKWQRFKTIIHQAFSHVALVAYSKKPWPALEDMTLTPLENESAAENAPHLAKPKTITRKWVIAHTTDAENKPKITIMEVEVIPKDPYVADISHVSSTKELASYTVQGSDPNLRITHYPSNRLH